MTVDGGHRKIAVIWEEGGYGEDLAYQYRVALDALDAHLAYRWLTPASTPTSRCRSMN
jgi:hypothetical protein